MRRMMSALSHTIRRTAARLSPDPTPDGELLSRFLTSRDEAAFAVLVRRHGRMVLGACRRVLGNAADADDAFQAVFVVLVRKAHSLTDRTCVGNFLYATAVLTARKARTMATRRRANEAKAVRSESAGSTGVDDEVTQVLDEELAGLPDKYREPVVLCEVEGVSRKEAAARLGIPEGTISSRLATAHRMLAKRLTARGFAAVAVTAVLGTRAFAVPDSLADAAVRAAADGPPAGVTQLVSEVTKMLLWNKLRAGVAVLAGVLLLLGVGGGMVRRGVAADDKPGGKAPVPEKKAEPKDEDLLQGSWQAVAAESDGKKAPDEAVKAVVLRFKGTEATFPGDLVMTFALDPESQPKGLTLTPTAGPNQGMKVESAIYELTGDGLKVCVDWGRDGKAGIRPTDFTTAPRDGRISVTLKRVKEDKKGPAKQPADVNEEYTWKDTKQTRVVRTLEFGGEKVEFVKVPKGSFTMGSPESDKEAEDVEKPQHKVTFTKDLWVGKHPVTKGQFAAFVKATGYKTEAETDGKGAEGFNGKALRPGPNYTWKETGWEQTDQHPVVNVSWNDAVKYCEWASKESKLPVRLPTETEYEYANRGGTGTIYLTGDEVASLEGYANIADTSANAKWNCKWAEKFDDGESFTSPVGKYKPNGFGLLDMTGNVWSWCADWSDSKLYRRGDVTDPAANTHGKTQYRILRGGSWYDISKSCRAANRSWAAPDARLYNIGFRVVSSQPGTSEGEAKGKDEPKEDEGKNPDDAKLILGKWVQTAFSVVPDDNTLGPGAPQSLTFDEKRMHNDTTDERGERRTIDCRYELNPTARPKELTLIGKESKSHWIYELDGDQLKMAVLDDGTRPASFDPREIPKGRAMKVTAFAREKAEAKKADEPTWKADFRKTYGLKDGELVRRVAPPYPDCRAESFRDSFERLRKRRPTEAELNDEVSTFTQFNWKDGIASTGWQTRCAPDDGVTLQFLLSTVAGYPRSRIESDEPSLQQKVTDDFITRTGADPEKVTAQLNEILRKELDLPVRLSFQDIEEEVFVLSGKYEAKPLEDREANEVEVYAVRLIDRTIGGGGSGTFRELTDAVERHVNRPIVLEKIDGQPKRIVWHFNCDKPPTPQIEAQERDADTLLANVAAQTGLTVKTEKRKVRKLVVEHSEVKK